jgi:SAM-dependent methyltransferase
MSTAGVAEQDFALEAVPNDPTDTACPERAEIEAIFRMRHGDVHTAGWGPRTRFAFGYFTPDDVYQATVARLVQPGCRWIDVGGGRSPFPDNPRLAEALAARCGFLMGLDPDETLAENPYVHERAYAPLENYQSSEPFDLATLRMVAEHIAQPEQAVAALARLVRPGGKVVVYTVNRWSPIALASWLVPFGLHHPVKRLMWRTDERDTFPVAYRMNTRRQLAKLFAAHGFLESWFAHLDDCRTFHRFRWLHFLELSLQRLLRSLRLPYPETCLLGVYERTA